MRCYSQQYAFEILKEYPLEKWVKYRDGVYILFLSDGSRVILFGNYGGVPYAYKTWI